MVAAYPVLLTQGAEQDVEEIFDFIANADSAARAQQVLDGLMAVIEGLAHFPERGSYPQELLILGIKEYRQTMFKPWRVIYAVQDDQVIVYLVADGRRDMAALLARRLLAG